MLLKSLSRTHLARDVILTEEARIQGSKAQQYTREVIITFVLQLLTVGKLVLDFHTLHPIIHKV